MNKFKVISVLALVLCFSTVLSAQYPTTNPLYQAVLANDILVAPNVYEFDIILKHTGGGTPFECQGAQIGLLFNKRIRNGGILSALYIAGTSQMVSGQIPNNPTIGTVTGDTNTAVFRIAPKQVLTPGNGTVITNTGTRLGRFRLSTSAISFIGNANLLWNFLTTSARYPTKIAAFLDDGTGNIIAKDITTSSTHINNLTNPPWLSSYSYYAQLINDQLVSPNQYEFDIYIRNTGTLPIVIHGLQVCLLFDDAIRNNGGLPGSTYLTGTSEMVSTQVPDNPNIDNVVGNKRVWKLAPKYSSSYATGTTISGSGNGTRLGRFRITTTAAAFSSLSANISWNFDSTVYLLYPTKVYGYDLYMNLVDFTYPPVHDSNLLNLPLPVELITLAAYVSQRNVILEWKTASEINVNKFEIERAAFSKYQSESWEQVGEVIASGNSTLTNSYEYADNRLNAGKYFYRLKIVDNNGSNKYSSEIEAEVELPKEYSVSQNYPNPFNPTTKIDYQLPYDSKVIIELYGVTGEKIAALLNEEVPAGYYTTEIDANKLNLSSGVYAYRIVAQNSSGDMFSQVKKLVLTK